MVRFNSHSTADRKPAQSSKRSQRTEREYKTINKKQIGLCSKETVSIKNPWSQSRGERESMLWWEGFCRELYSIYYRPNRRSANITIEKTSLDRGLTDRISLIHDLDLDL